MFALEASKQPFCMENYEEKVACICWIDDLLQVDQAALLKCNVEGGKDEQGNSYPKPFLNTIHYIISSLLINLDSTLANTLQILQEMHCLTPIKS